MYINCGITLFQAWIEVIIAIKSCNYFFVCQYFKTRHYYASVRGNPVMMMMMMMKFIVIDFRVIHLNRTVVLFVNIKRYMCMAFVVIKMFY